MRSTTFSLFFVYPDTVDAATINPVRSESVEDASNSFVMIVIALVR